MGLGEQLRAWWGRRQAKSRRTVADRLKVKVKQLTAELDATGKDRDLWKLQHDQAKRQVETLESLLREKTIEARQWEEQCGILEIANQGQGKMIVAQQTFIDAATARASGDIVRATNGQGVSHARNLFPVD